MAHSPLFHPLMTGKDTYPSPLELEQADQKEWELFQDHLNTATENIYTLFHWENVTSSGLQMLFDTSVNDLKKAVPFFFEGSNVNQPLDEVEKTLLQKLSEKIVQSESNIPIDRQILNLKLAISVTEKSIKAAKKDPNCPIEMIHPLESQNNSFSLKLQKLRLIRAKLSPSPLKEEVEDVLIILHGKIFPTCQYDQTPARYTKQLLISDIHHHAKILESKYKAPIDAMKKTITLSLYELLDKEEGIDLEMQNRPPSEDRKLIFESLKTYGREHSR